MVGLPRHADLAAEPVADPVQRPVATPPVEVAPDGALGREVDGQVTLMASGAEDIQDGVEDVLHIRLAGPPAAGFGRDVGLDQGPLGVGEVAAGNCVFSYNKYSRSKIVNFMRRSIS